MVINNKMIPGSKNFVAKAKPLVGNEPSSPLNFKGQMASFTAQIKAIANEIEMTADEIRQLALENESLDQPQLLAPAENMQEEQKDKA